MKNLTKATPLTLHDFLIQYRWDNEYGWTQDSISWEECEKKMGKRKYKQFLKWMFGQTCSLNGAYPWDLKRFLEGLPVID